MWGVWNILLHTEQNDRCVLHGAVSTHTSSKLASKGFCYMLINEDKENGEILVEDIVFRLLTVCLCVCLTNTHTCTHTMYLFHWVKCSWDMLTQIWFIWWRKLMSCGCAYMWLFQETECKDVCDNSFTINKTPFIDFNGILSASSLLSFTFIET